MAFPLDAATQLLERSHAEGRLAHAYLITGPTGSGKAAMALRLIQMVGHQAASLEDAPREFVQVVRPESKSRRIRVEAMRALEKRMHLAVPDGVTKIGIIFDADRLLPEAANAFLKTLEEPPPQSLLLLLTPQPEQLLDTILSRCLKIPLHSTAAPERSNAETMLLDALAKHFTAQAVKGLSGALGFMQSFVEILKSEKEGLKKRYDDDLKAEAAAYGKTTEGDWLKRREDHYKALTESDYLQRRNSLVQLVVDWHGDALRQQRGSHQLDLPEFQAQTAATAKRIGEQGLLERLDALEALRTDLNTNVNETLALECGFLAAFG